MTRRPPHSEPEPARRALAERYLRLALERGRREGERAEFRRMGLAWALTLPPGPEKDRILSLDEQQGL